MDLGYRRVAQSNPALAVLEDGLEYAAKNVGPDSL